MTIRCMVPKRKTDFGFILGRVNSEENMLFEFCELAGEEFSTEVNDLYADQYEFLMYVYEPWSR